MIAFNRETVADDVPAAGFDAAQPAVCTWLGVAVFHYTDPALAQSEPRALRAAHVAAQAEPWLTYFDPANLASEHRTLHALAQVDRHT